MGVTASSLIVYVIGDYSENKHECLFHAFLLMNMN